MNIDSFNILSLLSSDQSLEQIQQTLQDESTVPGGFSDLFINKMEQLNDLVEQGNIAKTFNINNPEHSSKLNDLAGLLSNDDVASGFTRFFGKQLPIANKLDTDIDLKNTLDALTKVMNTLEGTRLESSKINSKISALVEKLETVKKAVPAGFALQEKLGSIVDEFNQIRLGLTAKQQETSSGIIENPAVDENPAVFSVLDTEAVLAEEHGQIEAAVKYPDADAGSIEQQAVGGESISLENKGFETATALAENKTFIEDEAEDNKGALETNKSNVHLKTLDDVSEINEPEYLDRAEKDVNKAADSLNLSESDPATHREKLPISKNSSEHIAGIQPENDLLAEQDKFSPVTVEQHLDKIDQAVGNLEAIVSNAKTPVAEIEGQLEQLVVDAGLVKKMTAQQQPDQLNQAGNEIKYQREQDVGQVGQDNNLDDQLAAIVATMEPSANQNKFVVESGGISQVVKESLDQQAKSEIKKETLSFKQMAEERVLGLSSKEQPETLLQQEAVNRKPASETPVFNMMLKDKVNIEDTQTHQLVNEKGELKFVTDNSALNRTVIIDNKVEIPPMTKHFAHPEWNKEMGERVIWMHKQAIPSAELRLNPKHLGPIKIKVDVSQNQATVAFTAQHAAVKDAIDAAIPKLREMFTTQQLHLADVNVTQENLDQRQSRGFTQMGNGQNKGENPNQGAENSGHNDQEDNVKEIVDQIEAGRTLASNGVLSIFA